MVGRTEEDGKSLDGGERICSRKQKVNERMNEEEREQRNLDEQLHMDYLFQSWITFLVISQVEMISYIAQ